MRCERAKSAEVSRASALKFFAALTAVTFLLRIFYAGHLYEDDGLWFTAAEEILRGKALYREIYFDKPPAIALLYAGLFRVFGAHILTIRLFTICYSVAISFALYLFGAWLYDRRAGLLAAALFALFSTTYTTGHMQGLNTDFLMALPYTLGAYLLVRSRENVWLALAGGACVGVAFQTNPKAIFGLIFFVLLLLLMRLFIGRSGKQGNREARTYKSSALPLALAGAGFLIGVLPFAIYIAANQALSDYWLQVWEWGARYADYNSWQKSFVIGITISASYFSLNNTLLIALIYVAWITARRVRSLFRKQGAVADERAFTSDITLLLWFAVSYAAMAVGGRFYSHY
ncbi:MAG TPA: glycosyltransferase family 39 protein, partial [Blastocatellia bacterium]|nr:glycosyltransferase family 39 protein [Blastocatellia bacterium]